MSPTALRAAALLLAVAVLGGCSHRPARRGPFTGVSWEWSSFALRDYRSRQWREGGITDVFVRAGQVRFEASGVRRDTSGYDWRRAGSKLPITLVIGLNGDDLAGALDRDWPTAAREVLQALNEAVNHARDAGIRPKGLQIDIEKPVTTVGRYADMVKMVRRQIRSDMELSATIAPEMLGSIAAGQLARSVDYVVVRYRWPDGMSAPHEVAAAGISPKMLQKWAALADGWNRPYAIYLDAQPTYFELTGDPPSLTGISLRQADHRALALTPGAGVVPAPGIPGSKTISYLKYAGSLREESIGMVAAAPHQPGLRRLLAAMPRPQRNHFLGPIISVPWELPDELAMGNDEIMKALAGEECFPEPQISLRPFGENRDQVVVRVDNVGCGRPALEPGSVRLRLDYPAGTVTHAERAQFNGVEVLRTTAEGTTPSRTVSSDTLIYSAACLVQNAIETGPIHLSPEAGGTLRLTAWFKSAGGQAGRTSSKEISLR